jgi:hypothetical protein
MRKNCIYRAKQIRKALVDGGYTDDADKCIVRDALADLMHLATLMKLDFGDELDVARRHCTEETAGHDDLTLGELKRLGKRKK